MKSKRSSPKFSSSSGNLLSNKYVLYASFFFAIVTAANGNAGGFSSLIGTTFNAKQNGTAGLSASQILFSSDYFVGLQAAKALMKMSNDIGEIKISLAAISAKHEDLENRVEKLEGKITKGDGLIAMVKLLGFPIQPFTVGVTVMFEVIVLFPLFIALKALMLPLPDDANPIVLSLFVHVNAPPPGLLVKVNPETLSPLHTITLAGTLTVDDA